MSKNRTAYCSLADFLQDTQPDFHQVFSATCIIGALRAPATLIIPDKGAIAALKADAESDDPAKIAKARDGALAHVLNSVCKKGEDFRGVVSNRLLPSQKVVVTSISANKVTIAGGEATQSTKFADSSVKGLAVWELKGKIGTAGEAAPREPRGAKKTGGYALKGNNVDENLRHKIALAVENKCAASVLAGEVPEAHLAATYSLAKHVFSVDKSLYYDVVLPNITHSEVDFYVLVEPHNRAGEFLIPCDMIEEWWKTGQNLTVAEGDRRWINNSFAGDNLPNAAIYNNRPAVIEALRNVRTDLVDKLSQAGNAASELVKAAYVDIIGKNHIGGVSPLFPEGFIKHTSATRKFIEDDLRYWVRCAMDVLISRVKATAATQSTMADLDGFFNVIGDVLSRHNDAKVCTKALRSMINASDRADEIKIFVNSSLFIAMPYLDSELASLSTDQTDVKRPADEELFFNIAKLAQVRHARLHKNAANVAQDVINALKSVGVVITPEQASKVTN